MRGLSSGKCRLSHWKTQGGGFRNEPLSLFLGLATDGRTDGRTSAGWWRRGNPPATRSSGLTCPAAPTRPARPSTAPQTAPDPCSSGGYRQLSVYPAAGFCKSSGLLPWGGSVPRGKGRQARPRARGLKRYMAKDGSSWTNRPSPCDRKITVVCALGRLRTKKLASPTLPPGLTRSQVHRKWSHNWTKYPT